MRLYTSFWSNPELRDLDAVPVSISRGRPRWSLPYRYRRYDELAPDDHTWAQEDRESFERSYLAQVEELGAERILADLRRISEEHGGKALCLLCWERPGQWCHRRVLACYIERETVIVVPELAPGMLGTKPEAEPRLFDEIPEGERA